MDQETVKMDEHADYTGGDCGDVEHAGVECAREDTSCIDMTTQTDTESDSRPPSTVSDAPSTTPWYKHQQYDRYWNHNTKVTEWYHRQRQCNKAVQYQQYYQERTEYHLMMAQNMKQMASYYTNWYNVWTDIQRSGAATKLTNQQAPRPEHSPRKRRHSSRRSKYRKRRQAKTEKQATITQELPPHEQFEMEITDEMIDFFVTSAQHKKQRDEKKQKVLEELPPEDNHVDIGTVTAGKNKATVLPPSERPGVRRTIEMKQLYGKGAAMIHGMETAMQLTYDRNCDLQVPKLWPHLPIDIKFR